MMMMVMMMMMMKTTTGTADLNIMRTLFEYTTDSGNTTRA